MRTDRQRGSAILLMVGLVLVLVLALFARMQLSATGRGGVPVTARLDTIDQALRNFVAQHRRLPCPASGVLASGAVHAGVETWDDIAGACNPANQRDGVVPWVTLGLAESEAADAWHGRITYRVQAALASKLARLANMSWCDPAGTPGAATGATLACTAPCSGTACMHPNNYLYAKGLQVRDSSGAWLNQNNPPWPGAPTPPPVSTGAAYVLISHGASGSGAYNAQGVYQNNSVPGSSEDANRSNQPLTAATVFLVAPANNGTGPTHFDDTLSHPTLAALLARAGLGPRTPH